MRLNSGGEKINKEIRINERIRVKEVRLIDVDSGQLGVVPIQEALRLAGEKELDLVEVAPGANPPVCKIMDFGKYRYQLSKRQSHKKPPDIKEVKTRLSIEKHDLERKLNDIKRFLESGHKVKVSMMFRGRERGRPELGMKVFDTIKAALEAEFNIIQRPKFEGNSITMVIAQK